MHDMRTTLTIDADLAGLLRQRARELGVPFKEAGGRSLRLRRSDRMILPDVNVLVHAHDSDSAVHAAARRWRDRCLAGPEGVGLAWAALLGSPALRRCGG